MADLGFSEGRGVQTTGRVLDDLGGGGGPVMTPPQIRQLYNILSAICNLCANYELLVSLHNNTFLHFLLVILGLT